MATGILKSIKGKTILTTKSASNTKYLEVEGTLQWAKVYTPDEFRGAVRWSIDFFPKDAAELKKIKDMGIQKTIKNKGEGDYLNFTRSTTKLMKGKLVNFTPPIIYDKDGRTPLVSYVDDAGKIVRSYDDPDQRPTRVGEPILLGNGSKVKIVLSVYPTAMGPGNRLESITLIDVVHYEKPETPEDAKEVKGPETDVTNDELTSPPW